ncbi:ATP-binding cassette domain-containing protein [Rhizobacter sp. AJA081-3]|nr:ATP-binding cassette domain-containing protein [Rhizobacter sp. AJA081-3]QTN21798.1 ATP-binding cassette domain-containing protein [Rhizobacter sp. AJA081-3]
MLTSRWTRLTDARRRLGDTELLRADTNALLVDILEMLDELERSVSTRDNHHLALLGAETIEAVPRKPYLEARNEARLLAKADKSKSDACECHHLQYGRRSLHGIFELHCDALSFRLGTVTAVIGANAAGKTTLLNLLAGELAPDRGFIRYPFDPTCQSWYEKKGRIAYVRQHPEPWKGRLIDNLRFESACHGRRGSSVQNDVDFVLHRLRLEPYAESNWLSLSGGYRTRFELARALLREPALLLLDEPLAHLDMDAAENFLQDVAELSAWPEQPVAVVISSQHVFEVEAIAHQVVLLRNGGAQSAQLATGGTFFELAADVEVQRLTQLLQRIGSVHQIDRRGVFRVALEGTHSTSHVLEALLTGGINIRYFRDITSSARRLM